MFIYSNQNGLMASYLKNRIYISQWKTHWNQREFIEIIINKDVEGASCYESASFMLLAFEFI